MTKQEYEYLQIRLSKLISKCDYYGNKKQVYEEGLLAAKSMLSEVFHRQKKVEVQINEMPTIDAVPVKFIDEVIEYLTKCRDYAIHEETKTTWDEQRQTLIMLLHEWDAWNECGLTGKYGERRTI